MPDLSTPSLTLVRPLSYQFPPPARSGQDFSWTLWTDTFQGPGTISYIATNLPPWLTFANSTLAFTGHPTSSDVGTYVIGVTASSDGQTASDTITLTVSSRPGQVAVNDPLAKQFTNNKKTITSCYPYPPTSINYPGARVPPGWSFSLGFEPQTFIAPTRVFYHASLADGSALPPWLSFNNQTVTFDGVAPCLSNTTESYNIVVAGSDTFGYTDVKESFNLTIAAHDLELVNAAGLGLNITAGSWSSASLGGPLQAGIQLDGRPIKDGDIVNVSFASTLNGFSYSLGNMSVTGTPPGSPYTAPINIVDRYGDTINTTLTITTVPSAFTSSSLDPVLINSTDTFSIDLSQSSYLQSSHPTEVTATYDPSSASQWISLKDHSLTGTIPPNLTYSSVNVDLEVKDLITNALSSATITLSLAARAIQSASNNAGQHGLSRAVKIVLGTLAALIGAMIALMMACIMHRRTRERAAERAMKMQDEGRYSPEGEETVVGAGEHWQDPHTPTMTSTEKLGEPLSAQQLVSRHATQSPCGTEAELVSIPYFASMSTQHDTWATRTVRYLTNPFARKQTRVMPNISHPVVMPSFSNAAYQAQLAAAVDLAGIVKRSGAYTYPDTPSLDAQSGSASKRTGDAQVSETNPEEDTTDSHFHGASSRASWESEPPFAWATSDTPGRKQAETGTSGLRSEGTNATFTTRSVETHETHTQSVVTVDVPVQRSDFRPTNPAGRMQRENTLPHADDIISIDGIHFPTDSDIAQTESSSDQEAIITTASRIDARQTLESPRSSTPGSQCSYTSRIPMRGPSPTGGAIITTQSRLVSLGKERVVSIKDSPRRDASQTAVVVNSRSGATSASQDDGSRSTFDSGRSTPPALPAFPSLPAIPLPRDTSPLDRILLGVAEPFHFYPPLSLHSSPSSLTSTTSSSHDMKPQGAPGATYEAMLEVKEGMKVLPGWIHFEDMELWGVPEEEHQGLWTVRVVEVSEEGAKRTVGRFSIEVSGET